MSQLRVHDLWKSYDGRPVLRGLDLAVEPGTLTAVLGPSGCGKTTLLRVIAGFERAEQGEVVLGGTTLEDEPRQRRAGEAGDRLRAPGGGLVPAPERGGQRRLRPLAPRAPWRGRLTSCWRWSASRDWPGACPTSSRAESSSGSRSRGHWRASRRCCCSTSPSRRWTRACVGVRDEVHQLLREQGATTVLVTHDQEEALSLADSVAVLRDGRIVQHAVPDELYEAPVDHELATFLGAVNVIDARSKAPPRVPRWARSRCARVSRPPPPRVPRGCWCAPSSSISIPGRCPPSVSARRASEDGWRSAATTVTTRC